MDKFDNYTKAINSLLQQKIMAEEDFPDEHENGMFKSFILILNNQIEQYLTSLKGIDFDSIDEGSLEYFYYLEGRIRYLAILNKKEVYYKQNSQIGMEYTSLCISALECFQFAFHGSMGLALQYQLKQKLVKSILLYRNLYDFGFKSASILESIISLSAYARDWTTANNYVKLVQPGIYLFLNKLYIIDSRFFIITIPYFLLCVISVTGVVDTMFILFPIIINVLLLVLWKVFRSRLFISAFGVYIFLLLVALILQTLIIVNSR
jgi:hypothetical protein